VGVTGGVDVEGVIGGVGVGVTGGVDVGVGVGANAKFAFIVPGPFMLAVVNGVAELGKVMSPVLLDYPENK
jgi:hypothetical protein